MFVGTRLLIWLSKMLFSVLTSHSGATILFNTIVTTMNRVAPTTSGNILAVYSLTFHAVAVIIFLIPTLATY